LEVEYSFLQFLYLALRLLELSTAIDCLLFSRIQPDLKQSAVVTIPSRLAVYIITFVPTKLFLLSSKEIYFLQQLLILLLLII